ncbi:lipase member H-like [Sipha flava]|uniref:Lipase member H-like n=1 Tax=Sipha flava TaxID=143950 RepID=A0A8B8FQB7_9HEMI|nr:lipase member H-like [Sipha flava]
MNGFYSKFAELQLLIKDYTPTIICLQETNLTDKNNPSLSQYNIYKKNRNTCDRASGGVAIFVSQEYPSEEIHINTDIEAVAFIAYVNTGGFNVITIDWSSIARDVIYPITAYTTTQVGSLFAEFLKKLIHVIGINPEFIHLIGHSLGAHVVGSCGSYFKSRKIGRITGLDPAGPGYEFIPDHLIHLNSTNAKFVDVIHTSAGSLGYYQSIGHVDFYPNSGFAPQPGCDSLLNLWEMEQCSHAYSYMLYTYSVYHKTTLTAVNCSSWSDFQHNKCINNKTIFMGHETPPSARGNFYMKTNKTNIS